MNFALDHTSLESLLEHNRFACADCELTALIERRYVPVIKDGLLELTMAHSRKMLAIADATAPEEHCGSALRTGYTGTQDTDKAIYRLKVRGTGRQFFTLPLLYILQDGIFISYPQEEEHTDREIACFRCKKIMYRHR